MFSLSSEFTHKHIYAIHNFFDIDKNGLCDENEFMMQLKKAEKFRQAHIKKLEEIGAK